MLNESHKILIVDDEPVNLMMLEKVLQRKFEVVTARSGQEALRILNRQTVSLLITDQRMPGITGTELLRKSRALDPDMVCMLITAETDSGTFLDAIMKSGAVRVIKKPWDPDKLLKMVEASLERYESHCETKRAINQLKKVNEQLDKTVR
jgi:DNA-binding NtrC family response regulator